MLLPDPYAGLRECHRMLKPSGILAFTTWQHVPWCVEFRDAIATKPELPQLPKEAEMIRSWTSSDTRWDSVEEVEAHFSRHGFEDLKVETATNTCRLESTAEVHDMLPYTLHKVIEKHWTEEEAEKYGKIAEETVMEFVENKHKGGPVLWDWVAIIATGRKTVRD